MTNIETQTQARSDNRLIWDDATPTRNRRPTTLEDIENDIHVRDCATPKELYETLLELNSYTEEDLVDYIGFEADLDVKITCLIEMLEDWSDGSPNILYCMVNGKDQKTGTYDSLDSLDLSTATKEEIVRKLKAEYASDDDEWYDDYDDDDFELDDTDFEEEQDDSYEEDDTVEEEKIDNFNEALSELDKMRMWHNGTRGLNVKACGNDKLVRYFDICRWQGFNREADILRSEIENRGMTLRVADDVHTEREDNGYHGSLFESDEEPNKELADKAWMMNLIISFMNNEDAYYGGWLYIWPDGESEEQCLYDFGDEESYKELEETFIRTYKAYHDDGLYGRRLTQDIIDAAHEWDKKLGLPEIEVLR